MRLMNSRLASVLAVALMCAPAIGINGAASSGWGFDKQNMDPACEPCKDFFQFVNGGWIAKNPILEAFAAWTRSGALAEQNNDRLHEILEDAAKNTKAPGGSIEQKIGDYYASYMDEARIVSWV
jgi:putative endopeptidase